MKNSLHIAIAALTATLTYAAPNFQSDVLPIFKEHCLSCHNPDKKKADLDLSTLQGVRIGGSGGEIVKAGVPDTSILYLAIAHGEDVEPMPPKKPKIPDAQRKIVHAWIAGGLIESSGGASQLREVSFDLRAGSAKRPDIPAVPTSLEKVPVVQTRTPPPILALASSPWADVVATSGHEQILLYRKNIPDLMLPDFQPVAREDLISRWTFDEQKSPLLKKSRFGQAIFFSGQDPIDPKVAPDFLQESSTFTFAVWLKPDLDMESPVFYGRHSFNFSLERRKAGWTVRSYARAADNAGLYFGRKAQIDAGRWQHVAVTCDGKEWVFYYHGKEVSREAIPDEHPGFLVHEDPLRMGGDGTHKDRRYHGGLDDLRVYRRALSPDEVAQIIQNASPSFAHIGTLPFPEGSIHDLRFSRNGEILIAAGGLGGASGKVVLYDVKTGKRQATIGDEQDIVLSADLSTDHQTLAIGTPSKKVKIFSAKHGTLLHRIDKHTDWVTVVRFSPDGKWLASGDRNGGIHVWETANAGIVYTLDEHKVKISGLSWRADGKMLASAAEDGKLVLWDMKDGWPTRTATAHAEKSTTRYSRRTGILDLAYARDGRILTTGRDRTLKLWQTDGSALGTMTDMEFLPTQASFSADGTLAFTGDLSGRLLIWDLATQSLVQVLGP